MAGRGTLHHLELWVADLAAAEASLGWLLTQLGWAPDRTWPHGRSWRLGDTHVVLESGPDVLASGWPPRSVRPTEEPQRSTSTGRRTLPASSTAALLA